MAGFGRILASGMMVLLLAACTQSGAREGSYSDGPRYIQPGIGSPPQQTDFFGNDLLRRTP